MKKVFNEGKNLNIDQRRDQKSPVNLNPIKYKPMKKLFSLLTVALVSTSVWAQTVLKNDIAHSRIQFTVTHLTINDITGNFNNNQLTIQKDDANFLNSKVNFTVDVNSIDTHVEARDNHLKSADFFEVEKFTSTSITKGKQKNYYNLHGNLTLHGVTKPVKLVLVDRGSTINAMNKKKTYSYQVVGSIKRSDFGVGGNFPEAVISNLVRIKGDFELTAE